MADKNAEDGSEPAKKSKMPLITGMILALIGCAGGFQAVRAGLVPLPESLARAVAPGHDSLAVTGAVSDVAYVPIDPLVISLGDGVSGRHLRFRAQLEVAPAHRAEVAHLMPRIVDVLNSYLRALELHDLTDSAALLRLRAQMLRRLKVVAGGQQIKDLLIMEFVLN